MKKVDEKIRAKRRKKTAEIFTPLELVDEILDKLPKEVWEEEKTFCDPAAGNGNFLVEVYRYKVEKHKHDPTKALSTIYGVELMPDNTSEMRLRLFEQAAKYGVKPEKAVKIIKKNIVCHDALTYNWELED